MGKRLRTRLLLGTVLGVLGAALVGTSAGIAATAEQSAITVTARCAREGKVRVDYTVHTWEPELTAPTVEVWYQVDGGRRVALPSGSFGPGQEEFGGHFLVDAPTAAGSRLVIIAKAQWSDPNEKSLTEKSAPTPLPTCPSATTTSTTATTRAATTTTEAVLPATSTTTGDQLPFTGSSSRPALLAGLGLLVGGAVMLWAGRARGRHAR